MFEQSFVEDGGGKGKSASMLVSLDADRNYRPGGLDPFDLDGGSAQRAVDQFSGCPSTTASSTTATSSGGSENCQSYSTSI